VQLPPGTVIDRYTIESVLGEGGMAVVYRARHTQLGSLHAMKVLKLPTAAIQDRLLQEGRVQAQLRHPNIVSVTDVVDVQGSPGLVMEFVPGSPLDHFLKGRELNIEQADDLARGIIEGVAVAHQMGLIHRDLKPGNIMLDAGPGGLVPKITDFGLAKLLDSGGGGHLETRSGMSMGTPAYMAPEQIESAKDVDARADVFSLGAILYELVTGERPFRGSSTLEVLNAVAAGKRTPVEELVPDLPDRMRIAIDGALEVDPKERIADCDSLLNVWTGESKDGRGGLLGPWDRDTVSQIGRALQPLQPSAHTDDSDTYFPTQGVHDASAPPPSVLVQPPTSPQPGPRSGSGAVLAGGIGGVAALLAIGFYATMGSGSPATSEVSEASADRESIEVVASEVLGPELPPQPEAAPAAPAAAPPVRVRSPAPVVSEVEVDEESEVAVVEEPYDPDNPRVDFLSTPIGATVKLDGLEVGVTPLRGYRVPKGKYKVEMRLGEDRASHKISVGGKRGSRRFVWSVEDGAWVDE